MSFVTGNAVTLDLRLARLPSRALAALIDLSIVGVWMWAWAWVTARATNAARFEALDLLGLIIGALGYPIGCELATRGRTVGALALGLRVVRDDGGQITLRHVLIRWFSFYFVDFAPWTGLCGGIICATVNRDGKRIGDLLAGTVVVRARPPRPPLPVPELPEGLDDWASRLDLTRIPAEQVAAARNLVQRPDRMREQPRAELVRGLAATIARRTTPAPPPGLSPEDFLTAIVAVRRARARERLRPAAVPTAEQLPSGWR